MKLKQAFHMIEVGDSMMAVPVGVGAEDCRRIIECNETAALILSMLHDTTSEDAIIEALCRQFDAEDGVIEDCVHRFIEELQRNGLLDP